MPRLLIFFALIRPEAAADWRVRHETGQASAPLVGLQLLRYGSVPLDP